MKTSPSTAFTLGISGPKEWLKEQKKKTSKFLLAPIDASRNSLTTAYRLLTSGSEASIEELKEVQRLLKTAGRDCVPQERNSFVSFQSRTGVEVAILEILLNQQCLTAAILKVCTFRLIVKNASSLLDDKNPIKLEAETLLSDLIRSFTLLNGMANGSDLQLASNRQKVEDGLMDTIAALDRFERGIKGCLDV